MYAKQITIDPAKPNIPLDPIWSMRYSAGYLTFTGIPDTMTSAVLVLVPLGATVPFVLPIDMATSTHKITIENGALAAVGQGDYYVYGFDASSRIYGLGTGKLNISAAPTLEAGAGVTPVGNQVSIYNQSTNSYYLITAVINDDGDATVQLTPVEE